MKKLVANDNGISNIICIKNTQQKDFQNNEKSMKIEFINFRLLRKKST